MIVASTIMLIVYLTGLENHRSLYTNALITTTILLFVFFCFMATGLYRGWKLKDTLGDLTNYFSKLKNLEIQMAEQAVSMDLNYWKLQMVLKAVFWNYTMDSNWGFGTIVFWFIGAFLGNNFSHGRAFILDHFQSLQVNFKNSASCKGNLPRSVQIALVYSVLYSSWIYAIILFSHYFRS